MTKLELFRAEDFDDGKLIILLPHEVAEALQLKAQCVGENEGISNEIAELKAVILRKDAEITRMAKDIIELRENLTR